MSAADDFLPMCASCRWHRHFYWWRDLPRWKRAPGDGGTSDDDINPLPVCNACWDRGRNECWLNSTRIIGRQTVDESVYVERDPKQRTGTRYCYCPTCLDLGRRIRRERLERSR